MRPLRKARSRRALVIQAGLALATIACFLPTLRNEFVLWDDDLNFTDNPTARRITNMACTAAGTCAPGTRRRTRFTGSSGIVAMRRRSWR